MRPSPHPQIAYDVIPSEARNLLLSRKIEIPLKVTNKIAITASGISGPKPYTKNPPQIGPSIHHMPVGTGYRQAINVENRCALRPRAR
jgi:hypothetical protein